MDGQKQRGGLLTSWLIFLIIMNIGLALFYIFGGDLITGFMPDYPQWTLTAFTIIGFVAAFFAFLIFKWKKIGFYGIVVTYIVSFIIGLSIGNFDRSIDGIIVLVILYYSIRSKWSFFE